MTTINPEILTLQERAELLQDGLTSLLTGRQFEERYFDQLDRVWGADNPEFLLVLEGLSGTIRRNSIGADVGQAVGNLSGIFPYATILDPRTNEFTTARLGIDGNSEPTFQIVPVI